jgi:hypothetical protein
MYQPHSKELWAELKAKLWELANKDKDRMTLEKVAKQGGIVH